MFSVVTPIFPFCIAMLFVFSIFIIAYCKLRAMIGHEEQNGIEPPFAFRSSTSFVMAEYRIAALFHQPFRSTCRTTDSYSLNTVKPTHVDFVCTLYLMGIWIYS